MSRFLKPRARVGVCPRRLVFEESVRAVEDDPVAALGAAHAGSKLAVVLSNHFVRYAVLPWSKALAGDKEWEAFGQQTFISTYGNAAAGWTVRVSRSAKGTPRVASAVDAALVDALKSVPGVDSVQPYLMAAFNGRLHRFAERPSWFILHEPGRLTLSYLAEESLALVRNRQCGEDWAERLPDILDRESAASGFQSEHAYAFSEYPLPERLGRYRVTDVTCESGTDPQARSRAMVLQ